MTNFLRVAAVLMAAIWGQVTFAQVWVQIEARPTEAEALERANDYASRLPDVNGYRLNSGWHAVALGPYSESEALARLGQLRAARAIPSDSFLSDGGNYLGRFFGTGEVTAAAAAPLQPAAPLEPGEETVAEARVGERSLTRDDRELIQVALKAEGFYNSVIDADFGPGTRRAMATWQQAMGYEPTGVMTTLQRRELVQTYRDDMASLNITPFSDARAGIDIEIPAGMVRFDRYEPPFVHYDSATDDGVRMLLISQSGDENTLAALYDIMQTLEIVPLNGPRSLGRGEFTLTGTNDRIMSHTFARVVGGAVKGFTLVWPAGDEKRFKMALTAMEQSFRGSDAVLPDTIGEGAVQNIDLLAGLDIRRPDKSRSGFYIDNNGAVLTVSEAVGQCTRITLNDEFDAEVVTSDEALGLALLRPLQTIAPLSVARLAATEPRIKSEIAVAGYSFGGALSAPSLTFGTLADVKGLDGDTRVQRLSLVSEDGDAGGPVFDGTGAVMGMLLPRATGARQLPGDVAFATDAPVLSEFLSAHGIRSLSTETGDAVAPEDLTALAADVTVLVSCWN